MTSWLHFAQAEPGLAEQARRLLDGPQLVFVATFRRDGYARLSAVEPVLFEGDLGFAAEGRDVKTADLARDPRCSFHNALAHRTSTDGELKFHGRARRLTDTAGERACRSAARPEIRWAPRAFFVIDLLALSYRPSGHATTREVWHPPA